MNRRVRALTSFVASTRDGRFPLGQLSVKDLCIAIGQKISLRLPVPLALDVLAATPFAGGDFFPGDLLLAVSGSATDPVWTRAWQFADRFRPILLRGIADADTHELPDSALEESRSALETLSAPTR